MGREAGYKNLIPPKKGEVRNPKGKPKGTKHLSTWIKEMMEDEAFELFLTHPIKGVEKFEGAPVKAIIQTALRKAANGDKQWADWLGNFGYGQKHVVEMKNPVIAILQKFELGGDQMDAGQDKEA